MKLTCTVTWPDETSVTAVLEAEHSSDTVPVTWTGAVDRIDAPLPRAASYILQADLQSQAERTHGIYTEKLEGLWPAMDEVKS